MNFEQFKVKKPEDSQAEMSELLMNDTKETLERIADSEEIQDSLHGNEEQAKQN